MRSGQFQKTVEGYKAFFPANLPPEPKLALDGMQSLLSEADRAIGALNVVSHVLPNPELLVSMFVQNEALLSSQIEGTQCTLLDVLGAEGDKEPPKDTAEVLNYVRAMRHGMKRLQEDDFPMCLRLLCEMHRELMQETRGGKPALTPGEFRSGQNWIGGTGPHNARFVPPPPHAMRDALSALEKHLHAEDDTPPLVKCALIHYQFETIHPFNDGNGRIGRLLIALYLAWKKVLDVPMLYLSAYLKAHQQEYYDRLQQVRTDGNYEAWLRFFLEGIVEVSARVIETTKKIQALEKQDYERIIALGEASYAIPLMRLLMTQPVVTTDRIVQALQVSTAKGHTLVKKLIDTNLLQTQHEAKRNRKLVYREYVNILTDGTTV